MRPEGMRPFLEREARPARSPAEVAQRSDIILTSLPGPNEVEARAIGAQGVLEGIKVGGMYVDLATSRPTLMQQIEPVFRQKGASVVDAPVTGGKMGAARRNAAVMVAHERATFEQLIDPHIPIPPDGRQVHGITDRMVRGQPTIDQSLPPLIQFLGSHDTILLAHHSPFDLSFLAMALIRLGIAFPTHYLFDTLDMTHRLYPTWSSYSLERVATQLKVVNGPEHRALSDAYLVKDIFLAMLKDIPTVKTIADVMRVSQPHTIVDAPLYAIGSSSGFDLTCSLKIRP